MLVAFPETADRRNEHCRNERAVFNNSQRWSSGRGKRRAPGSIGRVPTRAPRPYNVRGAGLGYRLIDSAFCAPPIESAQKRRSGICWRAKRGERRAPHRSPAFLLARRLINSRADVPSHRNAARPATGSARAIVAACTRFVRSR